MLVMSHIFYETLEFTAQCMGLSPLFLIVKHFLRDCDEMGAGIGEKMRQLTPWRWHQPVNMPVQVGDFNFPLDTCARFYEKSPLYNGR